jgi:LPXTG-motif cell wall-anchored protein
VIQALREAIGVAPDAPADLFIEATSWRCMDGKVYACNVGANIPCWEKADTSQTPSDAMTDFCATNPDADVIPAAVTGRTTVYTWRCSGGTPEIAEQFTEVDAAGYPATYWYEISAPAGEAPQQLPTTGGDSSVAPALLAFGLLLCVASLLGRRRLTADG